MKEKRNAGFSLVEVMVAITIMAIVVIPICSGMVLSARLNAKAEAILQARIAVSSTLETMMAAGIDANTDYEALEDENGVDIQIGEAIDAAYHEVTVTDEGGLVSITTKIRIKQEVQNEEA